MQQSFTKAERLKSASKIAALFSEGQSQLVYPVAARYRLVPAQVQANPWQVAFVVSKKKHKLAVQRNRAKRQLKEAFRLHKHQLQVPENQLLQTIFIYVSGKPGDYPSIEVAVLKIIENINKHFSP